MVKRALIVSNLYPPSVTGGAELVAFSQAKGLAARGLDVAVLAGAFLGDREAGSIDVDETDGVLVYRVPLISTAYEDFHRPAIGRYLKSLIGVHRPEVVHFHNLTGLGTNLIPVAKDTGVRTIVTLHDHWGFCFRNILLRNDWRRCTNSEECALCQPSIRTENGYLVPMRLRRDYVAWCLNQADVLVSPSRYLACAYGAAGFAGRRIETISYGVNLARVQAETKGPSSQIRFVCFAYLGEHKGMPTLFDAAERLASDRTVAGRWKLAIAGPGPLAEKLRADIASGRYGSAVHYEGRLPHDHAIELMNASDVVILPSIWPENEPLSLLEAIASGTAQMASRIGGNVELVEDEKSGLLFEPGDASDLESKMRRYVAEPELALRHGAWNKDRRLDFDEDRTLARLQALYSETIRAPGIDEHVVICAGETPSKEMDFLIHRFHIIEEGRFRVRFIWDGWADSIIWRQAKLLWLWDTANSEPNLARALKQGLPVLAPANSFAAYLAGRCSTVVTYGTYLEALGALAAIIDAPISLSGHRSRALAHLLDTLARPEVFHLSIERTV